MHKQETHKLNFTALDLVRICTEKKAFVDKYSLAICFSVSQFYII